MALSPIPTPTTAAAASKQIVVTPGSSTSTIYTVPAGKTFVGSMVLYNSAYPMVNGTYIATMSSWATAVVVNIPLTLVAGSTVSNGSSSYNNWVLIGTEQ